MELLLLLLVGWLVEYLRKSDA